ncbi:MAG: hypothetical protein K8S16_05815 [Bacteroidales bacterium]|nr:hypothetical protein [Bacteroidales bacterium]
MKIISEKRVLLLFLTSLITALSYSQFLHSDSWKEGYIVLRRDTCKESFCTIYGMVAPAKHYTIEFYKIRFKKNNGKIVKYQASDLVAFETERQYFRSFYLDNNYSFAERILQGQISVFIHVQYNMINNTPEQYYWLVNEKTQDGILFTYFNEKHLDILKEFLVDCPEVVRNIDVNKPKIRADLISIIREYNECVNGN